jgi:thiol-disulfide isomerase/thioredoxin
LPALAAIFICLGAGAQALKPGEKLPPLQLEMMVDGKSKKMQLNGFGSKLVILQFWNTLCGGCRASLPVIDSLQQVFKGQVQYILVSKEPGEVIEKFFRQRKLVVRPRVPMITGDTVLQRYFPYDFVPHHVWLSEGKVLVSTTIGPGSTFEKISAFLSGQRVELATPPMHLPKPNLANDVLVLKPGAGSLQQSYFSYILPAIDSLEPMSITFGSHGSKLRNRFIQNKTGLFTLFTTAYSGNTDRFQLGAGNVVLEVRDSAPFIRPRDPALAAAWIKKNTYLYDLMVPEGRAGDLYRFMQIDLERFFGYTCRIEKRIKPCYNITLADKGERLKTMGGKLEIALRTPPCDSASWCFRNVNMQRFISRLESILRSKGHYFNDATGFAGNFDIVLPADLSDGFDLEIFRKALQRHGLDVEAGTCEKEVLVIRDSK